MTNENREELSLNNKVRFVTATTLFDGHDASINISDGFFRRRVRRSSTLVTTAAATTSCRRRSRRMRMRLRSPPTRVVIWSSSAI